MLRKIDMTLYEINPEFLYLLNKESYTEEDLAQIDLLSNNEKEKAIILASYIKNITCEFAGVLDAMKTMKKRSERLASKIEHLSKMVMEKMNAINTEAITDSPNFEIRLYKNPPKVDVYDERLIPVNYMKIKSTETLCLESIKNAINHGIEVPGARMVQDKRLSIK